MHRSTTLYYTTYEYNAADQLLKKVLNVGSLKATTAYSYDKNGNLIKEKSSYNMSYAKACKCLKSLEGLTVTKGEITYEYDNENRLVATYENGKLIQAILYDGNGNRAYTLDKENVTSDSSASSVYENKRFSLFGRKCSSSKNDSNSIKYDKSLIKNELLKEYGISKFSASSYELTGYVTDLTQEYSQVLMEYGATGKVTNVYSYAEGRVSAIIDGRSYSYLNDGRGSVSELTMTSGSTAVSYRYDIYGKTLASNKCINNPYQYNAEYTDSTTGLQYLRARYYNSDTHRFQTKDTYQGNVAQPITRNNYAYANNNPVNFVDPSGHVAWWAVGAISGAVINGGISAYTQYKANNGKINWSQVGKDAVIGAVAGVTAGAVGGALATKIGATTVAGKVLSGATSFAVGGIAGRGTGTVTSNVLNSTDPLKNVAKNMFDVKSIAIDAIAGGALTGGSIVAKNLLNKVKNTTYYQKIAEQIKKKFCDGGASRATDDGLKNVKQINAPTNSISVDDFINQNVSPDFRQNVKNAFLSDAKVTTLTKDTVVYRYSGGASNKNSYWYTPNKTSNPAADLALPEGNTYEFVDSYIIPKGTQILEGTVAPNFGQPGGGYQYYVPNPEVVIK